MDNMNFEINEKTMDLLLLRSLLNQLLPEGSVDTKARKFTAEASSLLVKSGVPVLQAPFVLTQIMQLWRASIKGDAGEVAE